MGREIRHIWRHETPLARTLMILVGLLLLAAYLNIGWAIGTYEHNHILGKTPETFWQEAWQGGFGVFSGLKTTEKNFAVQVNLGFQQIFFSFFWPLLIIGILVSWIVYGCLILLYWLWYAAVYFMWLIFAGGIAKILGVG